MSFFKPSIYIDSGLFELPRPITRLRLQSAWDYEQFKVPLLDGETIAGASQNGLDIVIEGQVGSHGGDLKTSELDMLATLNSLQNKLNSAAPDDKYEFVLYHDDSTSTYRKYKNCTTVRIESNLSDQSLFTYSLVIRASDPELYQTSPGS
ncbi:hypothetical protein [Calycomorphotria hydatis]|uniref:Uncharacterized protein n=1 Tax=Calycomorphotria hydatis TaxID=2528027 RepID=A0A517TFB8_9PLAN|nr:hypothetical protein [Calycomorphotria hydatis]QDT67070.1 hypothetical protein V22_43420 [Calycomorphotria hydatis]